MIFFSQVGILCWFILQILIQKSFYQNLIIQIPVYSIGQNKTDNWYKKFLLISIVMLQFSATWLI